jgi:hypothetical protein
LISASAARRSEWREARVVSAQRRGTTSARPDGSAFDDAAGMHDCNGVGDFSGGAEIMSYENHVHAEFALQPAS